MGHGFGGSSPSEGFSWTVIHQGSNVIEPSLACAGEVGSLGHKLAQETICVFVATALPRRVRIAEPENEISAPEIRDAA